MSWKVRPQPDVGKPEESLDTLLERKLSIDQELAGRGMDELGSLKKKLEALAGVLGVSIGKLFSTAQPTAQPEKKERKKREFKSYSNPDNPSETWRGAGKRPQWLLDKLEAGESLEKYLIT